MKNLAHIEDKLEDASQRAPMRERNGDIDFYRVYSRSDFPWARFNRFLLSRVGQKWADVCSEFTHAMWVPAQHRNYSKIAHQVEVNTFMDGDKIMYFDDYGRDDACNIEDYYGQLLYVHPVTKILSVKKKAKRENWHKLQRERDLKISRILGDYHQLLKIKGIWFEVWADTSNPHIKHIAPHSQLLDVDGAKKYSWLNSYPDTADYWAANVKITKRQLSHKELIKYGVENDAQTTETEKCLICGGDKRHCVGRHNK